MEKYKRFFTYLIYGNHTYRILSQGGCEYDIIFGKVLNGKNKLKLFGEESDKKHIIIDFSSGRSQFYFSKYKLTSSADIIIYLNQNSSCVYLVLGSTSNVEPAFSDVTKTSPMFSDISKFDTIFFNEIRRIQTSKSKLSVLSLFLRTYDKSNYFSQRQLIFPKLIEDGIDLFLSRNHANIMRLTADYISYLDSQVDKINMSDVLIFNKIFSNFPECRSVVVSCCASKKNSLTLFSFLIENKYFTTDVFCRNIPNIKPPSDVVYTIISNIVMKQLKFNSSLIPIFETVLPIGLLGLLFKNNEIYSDSHQQYKEIKNAKVRSKVLKISEVPQITEKYKSETESKISIQENSKWCWFWGFRREKFFRTRTSYFRIADPKKSRDTLKKKCSIQSQELLSWQPTGFKQSQILAVYTILLCLITGMIWYFIKFLW